MSFREKSAWITFLTVLICFGGYFGAIVTGAVPARTFEAVHLFVLCVIALIVLQIVLTIAATLTTPKAERTARDEREALIQARSHTIGYYVLTVLVLGLGLPGHFGHPTSDLLNFALLDVVIATLTVSIAQIVMFRR